MTSKIKVDNINKVSDDTNIIKKCGSTTTVGSGSGNTVVVCGSTVTIGRCGGTVTLASGSTQTGFGRNGTVNWQTSIKTATFTATSGEGYFCNTSGAAFTVNLPSSPSAGDIVSVADYSSTFQINNLTIGRNGSNIQGSAADIVLTNSGLAITFVYADSTKGWITVNDGDVANKDPDPEFVVASGGSESTSGNYKIHSFTGPGTFTITSTGNSAGNSKIDYMVVAGGGGGGGEDGGGGGGGGGGYRESQRSDAAPLYAASPLKTTTSLENLPATGYPITVGGGGTGVPNCVSPPCQGPRGVNGSNSIFSTITSAGGGGGGGGANHPSGNLRAGAAGGSGGGGSRSGGAGGAGNTPPVSPAQGKDGGAAGGAGNCGGGGGGAETVGASAGTPSNGGGPGGNGTITFITGSPTSYSGGGGGNSESAGPKGTGGPGGGGGGAGNSSYPPTSAGSGGTNQGGGGGGIDTNGSSGNAGNGGSGRVIIRYQFQ